MPSSGDRQEAAAFYRAKLPMTDRALESGIYMRTLTKRETIAQMAASVLDHRMAERRFQEAADVADAILAVSPRDSYALVKKGSAIGEMLRAEFQENIRSPL